MMSSRWVQVVLVVLVLLMVLAENLPWVLSSYAKWLEVSNAQPDADVIVILSGEPISRVPAALDLYQEGYAPLLLVTHARSSSDRYGSYLRIERDRVTDLLVDLGVAHEVVPSQKGGATSTFDEAWDIARWVQERGDIKRLILVTDGFHTRRALYAFEKIFAYKGIDVTLEVSAAPTDRYDHTNWWRTEAGLSNYTLEGVKWVFYPFVHGNIKWIEESP